jgi:hypothetical protein
MPNKKPTPREEFENKIIDCFDMPEDDVDFIWNWIENHVEEEKKKAQIEILEKVKVKDGHPNFTINGVISQLKQELN